MSILPVIRTTDVPQNKADKLTAVAIVGNVDTRDTEKGVYIQVVVPLHFFNHEQLVTKEEAATVAEKVLAAYENGTLDQTLDQYGLRTFTARWNVRPEWFQAGYPAPEDDISYNINMKRLTRGLFTAAGSETIDFNSVAGSVVGFTATPRKDDPEQLQISRFFTPKK